ncbi:MAG TPA: PD-(D/E)XK nuclease family protein [Dehalococcoidia bacterium]|nr:PD-(D/E)XK nuclease family protein [Dehalococcoidia bacterium]
MPVYSHSQLSMYEECPLRYKVSYRDRIRRDIEGIEAFLGSRVHETLQKCYDDLKYTKLNSLSELLAYFNKLWQENWHDAVAITRPGVTVEHYRTLGERLIENYYRRYAPFDSDITIGTEIRFNFWLDEDGKYRIQGKVDRLSRTDDGTYQIHEYKTSAYLPPQQQADEDRQLGLYYIGVQRRWPHVENIRLVWHYLAHDVELVSYRTPEAVTSLIESTKSLIDEMEAAVEFPPKESPWCDWCEYLDLCPRTKHFVKVEALPLNEYLEEPGVKLVNKYASLKAQKKEVEAEMEKVREALVEYARREGVEVIKGSDCKATVKLKKELKFPRKSDIERSQLDAVIKSAGRWEEVSQLDTAALKHVVEDRLWSSDLIEEIMKYGRLEVKDEVRISKLKDGEM